MGLEALGCEKGIGQDDSFSARDGMCFWISRAKGENHYSQGGLWRHDRAVVVEQGMSGRMSKVSEYVFGSSSSCAQLCLYRSEIGV